jgi:C1A family cysteine protease
MINADRIKALYAYFCYQMFRENIMPTIHGMGMGRHRDLPDFRDHTSQTDSIDEVLGKSAPLKAAKSKLQAFVDLRQWCSTIENQGSLGSCTANAGVGMYEYFERRTTGRYVDGSRLFLYKVTRELLGFKGDDGAYLRDAMKAMVLFGIPPEKYWPYNIAKFNDEPSSFCYAFAQSYQAIKYYRLDPQGTSPSDALADIKKFLFAGLPAMFGFSVYSSMPALGDGKGEIPFPSQGDSLQGGHAVLTVGYDDNKKIGKCKGALLIRNSWGKDWGENGYGWLPYDYIESGLANDFWSMVKGEYVKTDLFK